MTGMAGHDPGISGHVRPESLVTLLRNTQLLLFPNILKFCAIYGIFITTFFEQRHDLEVHLFLRRATIVSFSLGGGLVSSGCRHWSSTS
jgi:hypothetical protein